MTGFPGAVVRGQIHNKIVAEFFSQPDVKAGTIEAILLGIVYGLTVVVLALTLNLGVAKFPFYLAGLLLAAYLAMFSAPMKRFYVFFSERMDKVFEL
jgi:hypothetical protein